MQYCTEGLVSISSCVQSSLLWGEREREGEKGGGADRGGEQRKREGEAQIFNKAWWGGFHSTTTTTTTTTSDQ